MSTSDPYVKLILKQPNGTQQELKTLVKDGQLSPEFGESFEFESNKAQWVSGEFEATISFEVWDDNTMSDDKMGQISFPLSQFAATASGDTVELRGKASEAGEYGTLTYIANRENEEDKAKRKEREAERDAQHKAKLEKLLLQKEVMTVKVISCRELTNNEVAGLSDPFVKLMLKQPDGSTQEFKTAVKDGELNPEYNETFEFESNAAQRTTGKHEATITFQVWDEDPMSDDLMGQMSSTLSQLQRGEVCTLELADQKGGGKGSCGSITFEVHNESADEKQKRIANQEEHDKRRAEEVDRMRLVKHSLNISEIGCEKLRDLETMSKSDPVSEQVVLCCKYVTDWLTVMASRNVRF